MTHQQSMARPMPTTARDVLHRAAERAALAPSIYNTQPWIFVLTRGALEIHVDTERRLRILDPRSRQLTVSCGAALYNARVAIAAAGYEPVVERLPDAYRPNLLARVTFGARRNLALAGLDAAIDRRHTNRRPFMGEPPMALTRALVAAAAEEGATLVPVVSAEHRARLAELCAEADAAQRADDTYVHELLAWTTDDPRRTDGVQAMSVPYIEDWSASATQGQLRSFDVRGAGWLPPAGGGGKDECRLIFCAVDNSRASWLRVGEALERVWLELTRAGYWASPLNQAVEVPHTQQRLRDEFQLRGEPQILLRAGLAPEAPATPRRPHHEVIDDRIGYEERT
jgi:nitroreductase